MSGATRPLAASELPARPRRRTGAFYAARALPAALWAAAAAAPMAFLGRTALEAAQAGWDLAGQWFG